MAVLRAITGPLLAAMLIGATGCCPIDVDLFLPKEDGRNDEPEDEAEEADLGTAEFPDDNRGDKTRHRWWLKGMDPEKYQIAYRIGDDEEKDLQRTFHRWADTMGHRRVSEDRFAWTPPRRCFNGLHCVYDELDKQGIESVRPIAARFLKHARKEELSSLDVGNLVVTFVQDIEYQIPEDEPFGVRPPGLVVSVSKGDCDSKSLLAHMILRELGIRSVLISSQAHKHTMLAVALPAPGHHFTWDGTKWAFVETTAKRSPIGHINPQLLRPNDWRVVGMDYQPVAKPSKRDDDDRKRRSDDDDDRKRRSDDDDD